MKLIRSSPDSPDSPVHSHIDGLIRFRWMALAALIFGVFPLLQVGYLQKSQMPYLMAVLALVALFNGLSQGIWSRPKGLQIGKNRQDEQLILVQLLADVFAATGLLFVVGSASNPFIFVLGLHAFLGGMLLRGIRKYFFLVVILSLLGILQFETYQDARLIVGFDTRELAFQFLAQWILIPSSWFVAFFFSKILQDQELRIRSLQESQFRADRLKSLGALTAGFSHQMATPLNSLKLHLDRAHRKSFAVPEILAEVDEARYSLEECERIFQNMAGVFSNSAGGDLQRLEVKSLVKDLLQVWQKDHISMRIETYLHEDECVCNIQPLSFANTVFDLLDNAADACEQADGNLISVRLYREADCVVLDVIDGGKGISSEILARLGEPFVTDKKSGNGLGIYAAHLAAQSMGGEFKLANNKNRRGATASLILPIKGAL